MTILRDAFFLARMDAAHLLRRRETILWTFVMPIVFFYFLGTIVGNSYGSSRDNLAVSIAPDAGFLADQLLARLAQRGYQVIRTRDAKEFIAFPRRLSIPAGFTDSVLAGKPMTISFDRTGEDVTADYDRVRLYRAVYATLADLIVVSSGGAQTSKTAFEELAAEPRMLTLGIKQAGKRRDPPAGFEQSVPGTMVMFTLLILFTSGAVTLTLERNHGILRRLASSPMSRGAVVLGKWGARMALGIVQIAFAMIAGTVLFHVRWGPNLPAVVVVLLVYGSLAAALGMLLGNFGRTEAQVIGLGVIASNVLAGLGGCWWPIEITPMWTQKLALAFPTGWTMDALHKLMNFGAAPVSVIPHVCVTAALALGAGFVLARSFRFQ
ncbi:MAG TPA: ABC transporter permease [Bryobacteraceae bacterium]